MSEWGFWDDEIDQTLLASLVESYFKRQKLLAQIQAVEVAKVLFGSETDGAKEISANEMFNQIS